MAGVQCALYAGSIPDEVIYFLVLSFYIVRIIPLEKLIFLNLLIQKVYVEYILTVRHWSRHCGNWNKSETVHHKNTHILA